MLDAPQVLNLDGTVATQVTRGQDYLVPSVFGIPIVCPSHIDEGNQDGPTGRHWHTDGRWGNLDRPKKWFHGPAVEALPDLGIDHTIQSAIIADEGQKVSHTQFTAHETECMPSGGIFTSLAWLYHLYGDQYAKDGRCPHHPTPLADYQGHQRCPSHGLRFKADGSPFYKAPFYVSLDYVNTEGIENQLKVPVAFLPEKMNFVFYEEGTPSSSFNLEDAHGEVIDVCEVDSMGLVHCGDALVFRISAFTKQIVCPYLCKEDPRKGSNEWHGGGCGEVAKTPLPFEA